MKEVPKRIYLKNFDKIYQWLQTHGHENQYGLEYQKIDVPFTHLKLVDVFHKEPPSYAFRVILNATYDVPSVDFKLSRTIDDLKIYSTANTGEEYSYQTYYVQLDESNNPCGGFLFSLGNLSEKFYNSMF